MKKLSQFLVFDWDAFAKDKRFLCVGGGEWVDFETKTHKGTKIEVVITTDHTPYKLRDGEVVSNRFEKLAAELRAKGISVKIDDRDNVRSGFKFAEYELKGVPVRLAMGPRDMENNTIELMRRDTLEKETLPLEGLVAHIEQLMTDIQKNIYLKAKAFRDSMITKVDTWEEFKEVLDTKGGFLLAHWDGTVETEVAIKDATKATIRCIPFDAPEEEGRCIYTGRPSHRRVLFARSY